MKIYAFSVFAVLALLTGCASIGMNSTDSQAAVRNYNGTASVGDFLTITIDSSANTIAYTNHTNGESGTVPYTINADGGYTITDPAGNLLAAYEIPGYALAVEAANAGPNKDSYALITAIESAPASISSFVGTNYNYFQFRHRDGGVEIGNVTIDAQGDITANSYDSGAVLWTDGTYFNGSTFPAASLTEDASGDFFTIVEQDNSTSTVFGTENGLWAVDNSNGTILGLPKAATKDFDSSAAGTYNAIYYEKLDAQMNEDQTESGTPAEGKATVTVSSTGAVTITDSQSNAMASGTLIPVADALYIYDGTANELDDPCYGIFTFRTQTSSLFQDVFVSFQGNAIIFTSFQTAEPIANDAHYTYFQGVGLK